MYSKQSQKIFTGASRSNPGSSSKNEYSKEQEELNQQNIREKKLTNDEQENRIKLIPIYMRYLVTIQISLIVFLMCIVCANGIKNDWLKFSTSDAIVISLMGITSFSPFAIGASYLFGVYNKNQSR